MTKVSKSRLSASEAKAQAKRPSSFKNVSGMTKQEMGLAIDQFCSARTAGFATARFLGSLAVKDDGFEYSDVCETRAQLMKVINAAKNVEQDERDAIAVEECLQDLSTFVTEMNKRDKALVPGTKLCELKDQLCAALVRADCGSQERVQLAKELSDESIRIQGQVARFVSRMKSDYLQSL